MQKISKEQLVELMAGLLQNGSSIEEIGEATKEAWIKIKKSEERETKATSVDQPVIVGEIELVQN